MLGNPIKIRPLMVSKLNTVAQILLAGFVLAALGFRLDADMVRIALMVAVAALTLLSIAFYLREWIKHMGMAARSH